MVAAANSEIASILADPNCSVQKRYNALFEARSFLGPEETVDAILGLLQPHTPSILLRHEACYVLGQVGHSNALPRLREIVADLSEHEITRHEAVEALAALGDKEAMNLLTDVAAATDSTPLRETCELALKRLSQEESLEDVEKSKFNTVDPVSTKGLVFAEKDIESLKTTLLDSSAELSDRYAALFSLRGIKDRLGNASMLAARAIAYAMRHDTSSALFRHELAFVLAQVAFGVPDSELIELIASCFQNTTEHCMVRHEAAVALGSIGGDKSREVMSAYIAGRQVEANDQDEAIVIESCMVSLESLGYWENPTVRSCN